VLVAAKPTPEPEVGSRKPPVVVLSNS
jgi:hypothetical protein